MDSPEPKRRGFAAWLWRRPQRWFLLGIPVGGLLAFIVGIGLTGGFFGALQFASTETFCTSCHEMKKPAEELSHSQHYANTFGIRAGCADCQVPPGFLPGLMKHIASYKELWGHLTGELDTPAKYESHRLEFAQRIWTEMKANDSAECRSCHTIAAMAVAKSSTGAKMAGISPATIHQSLAPGYTCIDCHKGIAHPISAQQPPSLNDPQANVVPEQQLLNELNRIQGRGTIPDVKSYVLEQPFGREWRIFHEIYLHWIGGVSIIGIFCLLAGFYFWRGSLGFEGGRSGHKILRFTAFERFVHWLTAICFIVLAISGLNISFGKDLLLPLIGPTAFSAWTSMAKYAHNYLSFPFTIGVVLMFLMWVAKNLPTRVDFEWMMRGGGMFGGEEPPAYKFNAGEKLIFWLVVFGGGAVAATGYVLLFPFYGTEIESMQLAQIVHSVVGVLFIASMLVHVYMGTIGMKGAFEGMVDGEVDANWAKSHHSLWYQEEMAGEAADRSRARSKRKPD